MSLLDGQVKGQGGCYLGGCFAASVFIIFCVALIVGFMGGPGSADNAAASNGASNWTGATDTVGTIQIKKKGKTYTAKMPASSGKLGHEQHFRPNCEGGHHNTDAWSNPVEGNWITDGSCGSFGSGMKPEQEQWYFNMRWPTSGDYPTAYRHAKVIITNPANGKRVVASVEEYGPGQRVIDRDGVNSGAPPDIYNYLGTADPYTGNPGDKKGYVEFGFAKDQNIPLGPLK